VVGSSARHAVHTLVSGPDVTVHDYACRDHEPGWSRCDPGKGPAIVLVRRGCFRRRVRGVETLLDPGVAFFDRPDDEHALSHPVDGGDDDTLLVLSDRLMAELAGGEPDLPDGVVFTTPDIDLRHRMVLGAGGRDEAADAEDAAIALAASILRRADPGRMESGRPGTFESRRRIVDLARQVLTTDPQVGLVELSRRVATSPYHLSRIFREVTGQTLTTYRRRLRIRSALDRLRQGDTNLAAVAADAGFADHAHLARTFRRELGAVPSTIRHLLQPIPRWY
jgi:AraC-like DNA-binding protein